MSDSDIQFTFFILFVAVGYLAGVVSGTAGSRSERNLLIFLAVLWSFVGALNLAGAIVNLT